MNHDARLQVKLEERTSKNSLRKLEIPEGLVDFCSNDYLGFARSEELAQAIDELSLDHIGNLVGSGASRLISANNSFVEMLESEVAQLVGFQSGLLFNSGYNSNLGFFSCVPQRNDVVLYDELVHASIRDGLRMGVARSYSFGHNSLEDLKVKLSNLTIEGSVFVVVESVYSMDGDSPDLEKLTEFCSANNLHLVVDEAHAFGLFGPNGQGKVFELGLQKEVYAVIVTFGKALGCHGAMVLGTEILRSYLVNFARSLIYTTMMSIGDQKSIYCALKRLSCVDHKNLKSKYLIRLFKSLIDDSEVQIVPSDSYIQSVLIPGNSAVKKVEQKMRDNGFWVKAILSPTVSEGKERIRICFHEYNTEVEVRQLVKCLIDG